MQEEVFQTAADVAYRIISQKILDTGIAKGPKARPNRRLHRSSRGGPLHRSAPKRPFLLNRAPHCKNDDLPL